MERALNTLLSRGRPDEMHPMLDREAVTRQIGAMGNSQQTRRELAVIYNEFLRKFGDCAEDTMPLTMANVYRWQERQAGAYSTRKKHAALFALLWKRVMPWAPLERNNLVFRRKNEAVRKDPHSFTLVQSMHLAKAAIHDWEKTFKAFQAIESYWHPRSGHLISSKVE